MFVRKSHWNVRNTLHRKKPPTGASELLTGLCYILLLYLERFQYKKDLIMQINLIENIASDLLILLPTNKNNEIDYEKK